jgi:hypothetical protein
MMASSSCFSRRRLLQWVSVCGVAAVQPLRNAHAQSVQEPSPRERLEELIQNGRAPSLEELLPKLPQAGVFLMWLNASRLAAQLEAMPELTVFVPIDAAWPEALRNPPAATEAARALIQRQVIATRWNAVNQPVVLHTSLAGHPIRLDVSQVNEAGVELAGLRIRNGFVHLVQALV